MCTIANALQLETDRYEIDKVFPNMMNNEPNKRSVEFETIKPLDVVKYGFDIIESCGGLESYSVEAWQNCTKTKKEGVKKNVTVCSDVVVDIDKDQNNVTEEQCHIIEKETSNRVVEYVEEDWCTLDINKNFEKIRISDAVIRWGDKGCNNGFGYIFDIQPYLETETKKIIQDKYVYWNTTFGYCKNITISNANGVELYNYSAPIKISNLTHMMPDLSDIRFVSEPCLEGGTILSHEIENYTASVGYAFVKLPTLEASGKTISIYYNNSGVADASNPVDVWSDGYLAVYHLSGNLEDSLGNYDLVAITGVTLPVSTTSNCIFGSCYDFNKATPHGAHADTSVDWDLSNNDYAIEWWMYPDNWDTTDRTVPLSSAFLDGSYDGFHMEPASTTVGRMYSGASSRDASVSLGNTFYISSGHFSGTFLLWQNGTLKGNTTAGNIDAVYNFTVGMNPTNQYNREFDGRIDEIRMSNKGRMHNYHNQTWFMFTDQTGYVTFGAEESPPNSIPNVTDVTITPTTAYTTDNLYCNATITDVESSVLDVEFEWYEGGSVIRFGNFTPYTNNINTLIDTLGSGNTSVNNDYTCRIRGKDGGGLWSPYNNDTITISNHNPTVLNLDIEPLTANENSTLLCYAEVNDTENTTIDVEFLWFNNSVLFSHGNRTGVSSNNRTLINDTPSDYLENYHNWTCRIRPYDGYNYGLYSEENRTITIPFYPPPSGWDLINFSTVPGMFLLFILVILWLGLSFIGLSFRHPQFLLLGYLIGFLLGFVLIKVSPFLTIAICLINIVGIFALFMGGD